MTLNKKQIRDKMLHEIFIKTGGRDENIKIAEICSEIAIDFFNPESCADYLISHLNNKTVTNSFIREDIIYAIQMAKQILT